MHPGLYRKMRNVIFFDDMDGITYPVIDGIFKQWVFRVLYLVFGNF